MFYAIQWNLQVRNFVNAGYEIPGAENMKAQLIVDECVVYWDARTNLDDLTCSILF